MNLHPVTLTALAWSPRAIPFAPLFATFAGIVAAAVAALMSAVVGIATLVLVISLIKAMTKKPTLGEARRPGGHHVLRRHAGRRQPGPAAGLVRLGQDPRRRDLGRHHLRLGRPRGRAVTARHGARAALALGLAASLAGNVIAAHPTALGRLVAAWPPAGPAGGDRAGHPHPDPRRCPVRPAAGIGRPAGRDRSVGVVLAPRRAGPGRRRGRHRRPPAPAQRRRPRRRRLGLPPGAQPTGAQESTKCSARRRSSSRSLGTTRRGAHRHRRPSRPRPGQPVGARSGWGSGSASWRPSTPSGPGTSWRPPPAARPAPSAATSPPHPPADDRSLDDELAELAALVDPDPPATTEPRPTVPAAPEPTR